jgi:hypothetical protein
MISSFLASLAFQLQPSRASYPKSFLPEFLETSVWKSLSRRVQASWIFLNALSWVVFHIVDHKTPYLSEFRNGQTF